ncbi:MAG TPA: ATP-binding cassette domain-containing protein [Candidatus Omnitrophota bacterium]|nr:ATP-binding cassette domain-containing protein [Candidatus Omnitrophota bacterium]HPS37664.1 ATP-binding cassette domain-containing protein [Candidatus Omnitrophota bacterium]
MIEVKDLTMHYGPVMALDHVSFRANPGEILGLLGPNGAGKTTAMRILTTYLYPSSGTAQIDGFDIIENPLEVRKRTGYLPETVPLYADMQVGEYLTFVGKARGLSGAGLAERLDWVRGACNLRPVWKHLLSELSKGYGQRVGLAQALIHDPKVLILDEPTSGLDPIQIIEIRALMKSLAKEKTVIFSTHILQEVEALADRIVIINEGKLVAFGTKAELARQSGCPDGSLEEIFIRLLAPQKAVGA